MREIAVVELTPDQFRERWGLRFQASEDNLDAALTVLLRLASGRVVGLVRHQRAPYSGTELYAGNSERDVGSLREEFRHAFELDPSVFSWELDNAEVG